jgi:hypothetical protein
LDQLVKQQDRWKFMIKQTETQASADAIDQIMVAKSRRYLDRDAYRPGSKQDGRRQGGWLALYLETIPVADKGALA